MTSTTIYYNSPIGMLRISSEKDAISEVHFTGSEKEECTETGNLPAVLQECIKQLDKYFAGEVFQFEITMKQNGTAFQQNVWKGLTNIPYGKTISYLQLSKNLGDATAIRAVGTANGKNNIAIIVPCHRVIGSNGSLIGYAGELWRKKWLLDHEAKQANGVQKLFNE